MGACLFGLAAVFFLIGLVQLLSPDPQRIRAEEYPKPVSQLRQAPGSKRMTSAPSEPISASAVQSSASGGEISSPGGEMSSLTKIQVGQRLRVQHPVQGELNVYVMGRVVFDELWQTSRGPQNPWVPTGNAYSGFWLETNLFLLNWQNRFYLLDERVPVSDTDIQRDFAAHARKFAQSDQTAEVLFSYPPTTWKMDDIGKFRVRSFEGEGLTLTPGAVGRFIHASGSAQEEGIRRGLVVEDYEGGGQDTVWVGYLLESNDIQE